MVDIALENSLTKLLGSATVILVLISIAGIVAGGGLRRRREGWLCKRIRCVGVFMLLLRGGHEFSASRVPPIANQNPIVSWTLLRGTASYCPCAIPITTSLEG